MEKTVVITGGNRGIGFYITKTFLNAGYSVVVGARKIGELENLNSDKLKFCSVDVRHEKSHELLFEETLRINGKINAWINNAGLSAWRPIDKIDTEFFDLIVETNLKSAFWGCKVASKAMAGSGGSIINISSIAGKRGSANNSVYSASKFAMNGLTQSLAKELGPKGIRVNAICPVLIKTDGLLNALNMKYSPGFGNPEQFLRNFRETYSALGYLPTGEDVAQFALYLSSEKNNAITGQCINLDCGVFPQ